jgi:hypothetical protein
MSDIQYFLFGALFALFLKIIIACCDAVIIYIESKK